MRVVAVSGATALLKEGRGGDSIGGVVHGVGREETGEVEQKNSAAWWGVAGALQTVSRRREK